MNRRIFLLGVAGASGCISNRQARLNILNWSDYVAPDTIPNFEREFGVHIRYGTFESSEEMLAKVASGNSGWDIVFPPNNFIGPMHKLGLLARLQHEWLPNLHRLEGLFEAPPWDPQIEWSVPYMHGATGIAYQNTLTPAPDSWKDFTNAKFRGRSTMLDDPAEVIGACLKKLGHSLNSVDPSELARAKDEALAEKSILRAYLNAEVRDQLIAGDVLLAQAWAVTAGQAMAGSTNIAFAYPREGFALFADTVAILRESGRLELAHRFVNYLLRPAVAASIVIATKTATANGGARSLLPEAVKTNPVLYPDEAILRRGEWFEPLSTAGQRLRDRIWTEIKSA